uniref:Uncharacterized protein n=1 Tax=Chromera velia CCMP2878 TaxID=1169474 RepID=A0A0G4FXU6_9ALVE|eukprot:Cvel_3883.t1-p1 / transcript=Cvel_3883.t1 / gene=Cvel_3883 / organism=Chromera_velia_CCMP2878 / gene_product=hypothetical protein / transcript_product=hypothetical protein / location=Cvel_scaffold164:67508-70779(+) / protein_length=318 / sequence_SO=supercontig / SO=protein_coding / is_pseudo=false
MCTGAQVRENVRTGTNQQNAGVVAQKRASRIEPDPIVIEEEGEGGGEEETEGESKGGSLKRGSLKRGRKREKRDEEGDRGMGAGGVAGGAVATAAIDNRRRGREEDEGEAENEEQAPSMSASSSYCYVKVNFGAVPQMQNKQHIKEWKQKWQNFCNDQLPRERFVSDKSWRNKMKVCFDKLKNSEMNRDIQRFNLLDRGVLAENIPCALRKEYGLLTFKVESKIALHIQFFPYHCDKIDKDGLPVVCSDLVFSYYTIHKRLDELLCDASKEKYYIDEDGLVPNILNSFTRVQYKEILRALLDEVFEELDNVAELNDLL